MVNGAFIILESTQQREVELFKGKKHPKQPNGSQTSFSKWFLRGQLEPGFHYNMKMKNHGRSKMVMHVLTYVTV